MTATIAVSDDLLADWKAEADKLGISVTDFLEKRTIEGALRTHERRAKPERHEPEERRTGFDRTRLREMLDALPDLAMARMMGMSNMNGNGHDRERDRQTEMLEKILDELRNPRRRSEDEGDPEVRQILKYKALGPLLSDEGGGSKQLLAMQQSFNDRLERAQQDFRDRHDRSQEKLAELQKSHTDTLLQNLRDQTQKDRESLERQLQGSTDQLTALQAQLANFQSAPPASAQDQISQLTAMFTGFRAAEEELMKLRNTIAPAPQTEQSTMQKIAYVINEASKGVSQTLEGIAKVTAAQKGIPPESIGAMPPPMMGPAAGAPPGYQPRYLPEQGLPPPPAAAPPSPPPTTSNTGIPLNPAELPADGTYYDPQGQQITREQWVDYRKATIARTGVDPAQVIQQAPMSAPPAVPPPPPPPAAPTSGGPPPLPRGAPALPPEGPPAVDTGSDETAPTSESDEEM